MAEDTAIQTLGRRAVGAAVWLLAFGVSAVTAAMGFLAFDPGGPFDVLPIVALVLGVAAIGPFLSGTLLLLAAGRARRGDSSARDGIVRHMRVTALLVALGGMALFMARDTPDRPLMVALWWIGVAYLLSGVWAVGAILWPTKATSNT